MSYRKLAIRAALAMLAGLGIATSSWGGTGTSNLTVSASVTQVCTISTTAVAFGAYDPFGANAAGGADKTAQGAVNLTCTKGSGSPTAVTIALAAGTNAAGNTGTAATTRALKDSATANYLDYELYQPNGTTPAATCTFTGTVWNDSTNLLATTGTTWGVVAGAQIFKVCGVVPKGQDPVQGTYADTVVATVNF